MDVLVVESPAKARAIQKYLGGDYQVLASMGHVIIGVTTVRNAPPARSPNPAPTEHGRHLAR